jgi:membrane protein implicated in regulation of membrane protease activity
VRLRALAKPFSNPRNAGTLRYAWGTLACAILIVVFLAMGLWLDTVIATVFTVIYAALLWLFMTSREEDGE